MVPQGIPTPEIAPAILDVLSNAVLEVGELLAHAYAKIEDYDDWVLTELPMRPFTADRVRAMFLCHANKPGNPDLPEPFKALWAFD